MKLSFVIPAHNEEKYLGKCLESVLEEIKNFRNTGLAHRTNFDFEIIVVNNASTDQTKKIARGYPGVIVVDEPEKGLTKARQAGFKHTSGDLIANIDADTRLTRGWIKTVVTEFSRHQNLVALSGPFIYYDLSNLYNLLVKLFYGLGFIVYFLNRYILKTSSMLQGGNFVVKRSAIEAIGGFDTTINFYGEDTDVARRLNKIGDVKFTFRLPIYSSGRRLAKEGFATTGVRYAYNYFWVSFFKKPATKTYKDIR